MSGGVSGAVAAISVAVFVAAPWLDQRLAPAGLVGITSALVASTGRRGWRHEGLALGAAVAALAIAFHWAPAALGHVLRAGTGVGLAFTVPIVAWDACRLALPFWAAGRLARDPRTAWLPAAVVGVAAEAFVPSIFPWKLGGFQMAWPMLVQSTDLFGAEMATFTAFAAAGTLVVMLGLAVDGGRRRVPAVGVAAVVITIANVAYGSWAMPAWTRRAACAPRFRVAVIQVDPRQGAGLDDLRRLTRAACADPTVELVCWPECSGGSYEDGLDSFADEAVVGRRSRPPCQGLRPLPDPPCPLIFGGSIYRGYPEKPREIHQAALLLDDRERLVGVYRKRHLMPFGEYVPGATTIPDLRLHVPIETEFDVGTAVDVLACGPARLGVMLCYEDMLPAAAAELVGAAANVLVSLVNGSSFADPLALVQHRLLAQGRAIELRRGLIRCAATGESCLISPAGTIERRLPTQQPGWFVVDVPLLEGRTVAARLGRAFPAACGLCAVGLAVRRRARDPRAA